MYYKEWAQIGGNALIYYIYYLAVRVNIYTYIYIHLYETDNHPSTLEQLMTCFKSCQG